MTYREPGRLEPFAALRRARLLAACSGNASQADAVERLLELGRVLDCGAR
jgi:hypothetical protein